MKGDMKKRHHQSKVLKLLGMFPAVVIIGPRQCGKSTLAQQCVPNWKTFDLEKPSDYDLIAKDVDFFFKNNSNHIIIDEAQEFPPIFKSLRGVLDAKRQEKGRFIITGSSSPEIIKNIDESLAGRAATIELSPFSIGELYEKGVSNLYTLLQERRSKENIDQIMNLPSNYNMDEIRTNWFYGGFPEPVLQRDKADFFRLWMDNYLGNYLNRDIRGLFPKLNLQNYRRFINTLSHVSGTQINKNLIASNLEISNKSVKDYLDILHSTFIWRNLITFDKNKKKTVLRMPKGHFRDTGLWHYLLKINDVDELLHHPIAGFSFESFVIEQIIRGFESTMGAGIDFYFYRTRDKSEIDLIVEGFFGTVPIEIKLGLKVTPKSLIGLQTLINDMNLPLGILVNNGDRIEFVADKILQIPINFL